MSFCWLGKIVYQPGQERIGNPDTSLKVGASQPNVNATGSQAYARAMFGKKWNKECWLTRQEVTDDGNRYNQERGRRNRSEDE